jgi:hypothetical protein
MLGVIETLLDDGVLIFEEDLKTIEIWLENDPDLITDIIKVHDLANKNRDTIIAEHIYPTKSGLVYELATFDIEEAMFLSMAIEKLDIRSENLVVGVAYPREEDFDEGD